MKGRLESVQTRIETGTRRREARKAYSHSTPKGWMQDCPSQPRIRAYSRSFII